MRGGRALVAALTLLLVDGCMLPVSYDYRPVDILVTYEETGQPVVGKPVTINYFSHWVRNPAEPHEFTRRTDREGRIRTILADYDGGFLTTSAWTSIEVDMLEIRGSSSGTLFFRVSAEVAREGGRPELKYPYREGPPVVVEIRPLR